MAANQNIVLITGANSGIGLESVKALCQSDVPYMILLGGRSLQKAQEAAQSIREECPRTKSVVEPIRLDVEDDNSIEEAFAVVQRTYGRVDTLINNAGAQFAPESASDIRSIRYTWSKTWDVNVTGAYLTTYQFAPLLLASQTPRLLFLTSGAATLTENERRLNTRLDARPMPGWPKSGPGTSLVLSSYRSAKTGLNMVMREWARWLEADGVKVWAISPGMLATGLGGDRKRLEAMGAGDPAIGGQFIRDVVEGKRDADVGKAIRKDNVQPW